MSTAAWREAHREELRSKQRARYYANRERNLAVMKAYHLAHLEERKAQDHAYYLANKHKWKARAEKNREKNNARYRELRRADPERFRLRQYRRQLKVKYGLTVEEYEGMLAKQGGCCAICNTRTPGGRMFVVDHNHATGKVRGLLCRACNLAIGGMRDSATLLEAAAAYLRGHDT